MKKLSIHSALVAVLVLMSCSTVDPAEEALTVDARRVFGEPAVIHTLAGTSMDQPSLVAGEGDEIQLEVGQRAFLPAINTTLKFVEKSEDSRCPADVICVWEGAATVLLEITQPGQAPTPFEISGFVGGNGYQHGESSLTHEAFGLRFTLLGVNPYPLVNVEQTDPVTLRLRVETL